MALTQPILYSIPAYDAMQAQLFTFNVIGGTQVTANILTIKNNATLATVYSQEVTTFRFQHTVPANTLTNGTYYQAYIQTKDAQGNVSVASNIIQFYCYSQPSFVFSNIPINNIIANSSFNFTVSYNQEQGETLNAYVFNLYSVTGALIATSNTKYINSVSLPTTISYLFNGFEDNTEYEIECNGVTSQGTEITTGRIRFSVTYSQPSLFSTLFLTNNCKEGYVTIRSNVIGIQGKSEPSDPIYIDGEEVDLTGAGSSVTWDSGYEINNNFTLRIWGRKFTPNTEIFRYSNVDGSIIVFKYCEDSTNAWVEMRAVHYNWTYGYTTESNTIVIPADSEQVFVWVRRINNFYELKIENVGVIV